MSTRTAVSSDLPFVKHLQKQHSNAVGFLPGAALDWYIGSGNLIITRENDDAAGYLLGRPSLRYARWCKPITQAAICFDAMRRHHGLALVEEVARRALLDGREALQCWCADDIDAMLFWPAAGFTAVTSRKAQNARGRRLTLWRRSLTAVAHPEFWTPPPVAGYKAARTPPVVPSLFPGHLQYDTLPDVANSPGRFKGKSNRTSGDGR